MVELDKKLLLCGDVKRALLVTGGEPPSEKLLQEAAQVCSYIACADSGAHPLLAAGFMPNLIVGDMDSIDLEDRALLKKASGDIKMLPVEKDWTDTQVALDMLYERGFDEVLMLGATGGRLDHEQGNFMLLCRYGRMGKSLVIWNDTNVLRYVDARIWQIPKNDSVFSIVPLSDAGMTLSLCGFHYLLNEVYIPFGISRCLSNTIEDAYGVANIISGDGWMFLSRDA